MVQKSFSRTEPTDLRLNYTFSKINSLLKYQNQICLDFGKLQQNPIFKQKKNSMRNFLLRILIKKIFWIGLMFGISRCSMCLKDSTATGRREGTSHVFLSNLKIKNKGTKNGERNAKNLSLLRNLWCWLKKAWSAFPPSRR